MGEIFQPGFVAASIFTKPGEVEARNIVREAAGIATRRATFKVHICG